MITAFNSLFHLKSISCYVFATGVVLMLTSELFFNHFYLLQIITHTYD
jgi:hypothetical protein